MGRKTKKIQYTEKTVEGTGRMCYSLQTEGRIPGAGVREGICRRIFGKKKQA